MKARYFQDNSGSHVLLTAKPVKGGKFADLYQGDDLVVKACPLGRPEGHSSKGGWCELIEEPKAPKETKAPTKEELNKALVGAKEALTKAEANLSADPDNADLKARVEELKAAVADLEKTK